MWSRRTTEGKNDFLDEESLDEELYPKESERGDAKKNGKGYFWGGLVAGMALSLFILCVAYLAARLEDDIHGLRDTLEQSDSGLSGLAGEGVQAKIEYIEKLIRENYYWDEDIDEQEMENGLYRGLVASLGDIYSEYYTAQEWEDMMQQTEGIYFGIGAGVQQDTETLYPKIVTVYKGTPSEEAGLRENDIIYEVDGVSTYNMSTTDVVALIKGEEGTYVNLTIYREGESDYLSFDVQRRQVSIPTVNFEMLEDGQAYIQITEFDEITVSQFEQALADARAGGMKGLILDIRSNPGGRLDAVVDIAGMILPKGLVVYTEDKYGNRRDYNSDGEHPLEVPLVVMINGNSASASEILAGAVKDYGIGKLLGTTTFGKGIVQTIIQMTDRSAVKLTVSSYFTPKGNNIHGIGIEPDVECVFDGEAYYGDPARPDNQLEEAKKVLKQMMEE